MKKALIIDEDGYKFTVDQFAFINNYMIHGNATRAYMEAGYKTSLANARTSAYRLLRQDKFREYLRLQYKTESVKEKMSHTLNEMVSSDLGEIYLQSNNSFDISEMRKAGQSHHIKSIKIRETTRTDKEGNTTKVVENQIEQHDKIRAIEVLSKIEGWISSDTTININNGSAAQKLRERAKELQKSGLLKNKKR